MIQDYKQKVEKDTDGAGFEVRVEADREVYERQEKRENDSMGFVCRRPIMKRAGNRPPSLSECCGTPAPTWTGLSSLMSAEVSSAKAVTMPIMSVTVMAIVVMAVNGMLVEMAVTVASPVAPWMIYSSLDVDAGSVWSIIRLDKDGTRRRRRRVIWFRMDDTGDKSDAQPDR